MARCNRVLSIRNVGGAVAPGVTVTLGRDTSRFTLRAVDAAGAPVAFTVARAEDAGSDFHFAAGEAYSEDNLKLDDPLALTVISAAASVLELITWDG